MFDRRCQALGLVGCHILCVGCGSMIPCHVGSKQARFMKPLGVSLFVVNCYRYMRIRQIFMGKDGRVNSYQLYY